MSDNSRTVYLNGRFVAEHAARVSLFDSGLTVGDMAFEVTRTFRGEPFQITAHLHRLQRSMTRLGIDCGLTLDELEALTVETLARNQATEDADVDWAITQNVSRGLTGPYSGWLGDGPTVAISCLPLIPRLAALAPCYRQGLSLIVPPQRSIPAALLDPHIKCRSRVHYQLATSQAERLATGSWAVLLDTDGYLTEGTACNVFLVQDGCLLTPTDRDILPGVSRQQTLELARAIGIETRETDLTVFDAEAADEILCSATSFCLLFASSFGGRAVGNGGPGPVYQSLLQAWQKHVGVDVAAQAADYAGRLPAWLQAQVET